MSIRKHGQGWQVRVAPFPAKTLPLHSAAKRYETELKHRKAAGQTFQERPTVLRDELENHIERKQAFGGRRGPLRPASVRDLGNAAAVWGPIAHLPLHLLRRSLVEDTLMQKATVAPVMAAHGLQLLKTVLRDAESRGQVVDPGILLVQSPMHEPVRGVALEPKKLYEICSFMPERIGRIVPFCGTVGLRLNEALTLTDDRVNLEAATLRVPHGLNKSRRDKTVPLAKAECAILAEQLLVRPAGTKVVFPTEKGNIYSPTGFLSVWMPALAASGLAVKVGRKQYTDVTFRFHWLRHTAISLMARAGMRPELIAERVGHTDGGKLIFERYRHLYPTELASAVGLVDELLERLNPDRGLVASGQ